MTTTVHTQASYLEAIEQIINDVIAPNAVETDRNGAYPRAALQAMGKAGLLGLISKEVGGMGHEIGRAHV